MSENKIELWTPWEWEEMTTIHLPGKEPQGTTIMSSGGHYVCHQLNIRPIEKRKELAHCICSAVNGTYGVGISPDAVKDMRDVLADLIDWHTTSNGEGFYAILENAKAALNKSKL